MTKEVIEDFRFIVIPYMVNRFEEINYEGQGGSDAEEFKRNFNEICDLAIKALEQEPTTKNDLGVDCISREQAKVAIRDKFKDIPSRVEINTILNELPSVTPHEPSKGHWINTANPRVSDNIVCSECGYDSIADFNYCPNCGADMREVKE